jgi:hypothetical protein
MKKSALLIFIAFAFSDISAQIAADIDCQQNIFYAIQGNEVHLLQMNATTVTDAGIYASFPSASLGGLAFGNDITTGSTNRTFYCTAFSGLNPSPVLRYTGTSWDTLSMDTLIYHNAAAYGPYIYFQHNAAVQQPNDQCISRLNANGTLTKIFTDTSLRFTVADMAVDSAGNIYCFRGPQIGNTTEVTVLNSSGAIINSFSTTLNNLSTIYGAMFLNDTLWLGWGTTNGQVYPLQFVGSTASLGTPRNVPVGISYKDFANCFDSTGNTKTLVQVLKNDHDKIYPNPATNSITIESSADFSQIEIYDIDCRLTLKRETSGKKCIMDVSMLRPGIYNLRLRKKNSDAAIMKLLIQ